MSAANSPVGVPDPAEVEALAEAIRGHLHCGHDGGVEGRYTWTCGFVSSAYSVMGWEASHLAAVLTSDWLADHDRTRERELGERIAAAIGRMPLTRITERPAMGGMVHTAYPAEVIRAEAARIARAESERARQHTVGVELHCDDCQQPYAVWFTDNEVWNFVMSGGTTTEPEWGGMLCPRCFTLRAKAVYDRPIWQVRLERVAGELARQHTGTGGE